MAAESILIVGRGPSAFEFDWSDVDCPIMAVSSGIFAIPLEVQCDHFVTLDEPMHYMVQLNADEPIAWENDPNSRYWPFWADAKIVKHVVTGRMRTIENLPMPIGEVVEAIRDWKKTPAGQTHRISADYIKDRFYATLGEHYSSFGIQPGWGDYQNLRGWEYARRARPVWFGKGHVAIPKVFNSLFMAVQIATRLGHTTLRFIGVDLPSPLYDSTLAIMKRWHRHASRNGITWVNHSPVSRLRDFVQTDCMMDMEQVAELLAA